MNAKPNLLCVSRDAVLNRTRRLILERCFEVKLAHTEAEAVALLSGQSFDLVLLCYSLSDGECRGIVEMVHSLPTPMRILLLAEGRDRVLLGPRDEVFAAGGPAELLRQAASMAGVAPHATEGLEDEPAPEAGEQPV